MANSEWQEKMNELRDAQLVTQRLMEVNERRWNERFEKHDAMIAKHNEAIAKHDEAIAKHDEAIAKHDEALARMEAAMYRLFEHIDQFIQGKQSNGHE